MAKSASVDVQGVAITTTPTVSAWADEQFVGDARAEKLLSGFGSEDQAALPFRTTFLGLHEAAQARAEVLHDPTIAQTRWQRRSFFLIQHEYGPSFEKVAYD